MTHQDQGRNGSLCSHAYDLHKALRWLMAGVSMSGIVFRPECTWTPETLLFAALLWAWPDEKTLIERFTTARKIIINRYAEQPEPAGSYQAFIKMLCKWTEPLREALSTAFRQRMVQTLAAVWMVEGWLVFAIDGSRQARAATQPGRGVVGLARQRYAQNEGCFAAASLFPG